VFLRDQLLRLDARLRVFAADYLFVVEGWLYLGGAQRVALGEWVTVQSAGQHDLRGQVIDAGQDVTVVQVLEETLGVSPASARITLSGDLARVVVGRDLVGRALSGVGDPKDGLPRPIGEAHRPFWGAPINPSRRVPPRDFIETGISAIDGLNTLVRGQKLPVFSSPGLRREAREAAP
jgi:V/A-type H+-transporting ATPase subunit B